MGNRIQAIHRAPARKLRLELGASLDGSERALQVQPPRVSGVIAALDEATEVLFPMTEFHQSAYELYKISIEGRATTAYEDLLKTLGIRF